MYNITREEASNILNISTRSIDRYIRAGKLRSKKDGKIVYIHADDVNNFSGNTKTKQEVIVGWIPFSSQENLSSSVSFLPQNQNIEKIFDKLREEIFQKDEQIKDMSMKIGKMEEIVKNSISMIEYKKTQFLLEESKNSLAVDLETTKKDLEIKQSLLKEEKKLNYILIITTILLFLVLVMIWLVKI